MITLKYKKCGTAVFISHIDTLRGMVRAIRRAQIKMEYSKGFNPHMLLFFSPPLALGLNSRAEYVTADCRDMTAKEFLEAYNGVYAPGFKGIECFETQKSPNLAGKIFASEYFLPSDNSDGVSRAVKTLSEAKTYNITYTVKGNLETKDVRSLIYDVAVADSGLTVKLATGNTNLRADRLINALNADFGLNIEITEAVKTRQFVNVGGKAIDVDDYLKNLGE